MRLLLQSKDDQEEYLFLEVLENTGQEQINTLIDKGKYIKATDVALSKGHFLGVLTEKGIASVEVELILSNGNLHRDLMKAGARGEI